MVGAFGCWSRYHIVCIAWVRIVGNYHRGALSHVQQQDGWCLAFSEELIMANKVCWTGAGLSVSRKRVQRSEECLYIYLGSTYLLLCGTNW
jgi:hypothetical protein